ncbi:M48 family metallopeptidase [Marinicellulosiphila megalodicopiae]|uniref:M48 family metallopeptidase n=1 Tax=Marinicellulosiphila megalodicopiae TaxID=2724896 RepID=UPI003BAFE761
MSDSYKYQPPASEDADIKKMKMYLLIFFSSVFSLVLLIIIFAPTLAKIVPFSAEKQFVKPYEVLSSKYLSDDVIQNETSEYLIKRVNILLKNAQIDPKFIISVHLIDSKEVNAFATLGGHIFVFQGLIDKLEHAESKTSLDMVLAHEISHVINRDAIAGMGRGLAIQLIFSFIANDYSRISTLSDLTSQLSLHFYSRDQELEADKTALNILKATHSNIEGYDLFFQEMKNDTESTADIDDEITGWFSTHPEIDERLEQLKELE